MLAGRYRLPMLLIGSSLAITGTILFLPVLSQATPTREVAQAEAPESEAGEAEKPKKARPSETKPKPKPKHEGGDRAKSETAKPAPPPAAPAAQAAPAGPPSLAGAAATGAGAAPANLAAKLVQNGASTCANAIDAEAVPTMVGVTQSNTVSLWSNVEPRDKHAASVFVGQRYGANQAVPYGVTGLIASPTPSGSCDVTVVQVVASPLPCAAVRETLTKQQAKLVGEIVGMPIVQSGDNQTLLMPTATNSCVLVGFRAKFGN